MWVFDSKGKRIQTTEENARPMLTQETGCSFLWPKGTPGEETFEFEALLKDASDADAIARAQQLPRGTVAVAQMSSAPHRSFVRKEEE